jgi:hypothetical protein
MSLRDDTNSWPQSSAAGSAKGALISKFPAALETSNRGENISEDV